MKPTFAPGRNIAMKVPVHEYEQTVVFYRDILELEEHKTKVSSSTESTCFKFGDKILWIDCVAGISQSEIWLEVVTNNIDQASGYLKQNNCARRDEIEPLPKGLNAFWLSSPANIIHLVTTSDDT